MKITAILTLLFALSVGWETDASARRNGQMAQLSAPGGGVRWVCLDGSKVAASPCLGI
jgi:hypothetical protein